MEEVTVQLKSGDGKVDQERIELSVFEGFVFFDLDNVLLDEGVASVAFTPSEARTLAQYLLTLANKAEE